MYLSGCESIVKSIYCRCRGCRRFHEKGSKRTYAPLHEQGAWKERRRCAKGREGAEETRGRGTGETAGGHSPAASNRKGKTPGEHELVFGDIVTCRWRKYDDNSDGIGVQLALSLFLLKEGEREDIFQKIYYKENTEIL